MNSRLFENFKTFNSTTTFVLSHLIATVRKRGAILESKITYVLLSRWKMISRDR